MEGESSGSLMKRTLITVLALVSACVVFVGVLSLVAASIVSHAVQAPEGADKAPATSPAEKSDSKPSPSPKPTPKPQI